MHLEFGIGLVQGAPRPGPVWAETSDSFGFELGYSKISIGESGCFSQSGKNVFINRVHLLKGGTDLACSYPLLVWKRDAMTFTAGLSPESEVPSQPLMECSQHWESPFCGGFRKVQHFAGVPRALVFWPPKLPRFASCSTTPCQRLRRTFACFAPAHAA